ncbi:MAG TPA: NAD-dependent epimerase/dehydratase family protein [Chthoniobacteraceae bacterium]
MPAQKTIFITGVAGFLGRYVARQFTRDGWKVIGLDDVPPENAQLPSGAVFHRMKLPSPQLAELIRETAPAACVHCAGRASVPLSMSDPAADFSSNVALTFEVLEALREHAPRCRFLFLSSAAVYGNPASLPVAETHAVAPLSPYGYHKRQAELLCEEFSRIYGLPTAVLRIFSAYGPGLRRQVVWDICEKVITTGALHLRGTGAESRDFIHAADVARALALLAENGPAQGDIYNLAAGRETTIAELAELVIASVGAKVTPSFDGQVPAGDPLHWRAEISKLAALGFTPATSLEQGVRAVATWSSAELQNA